MFPKAGPLWKRTLISMALPSISFGVTSKGALPPGSPHRAPSEREAPFTVVTQRSPWILHSLSNCVSTVVSVMHHLKITALNLTVWDLRVSGRLLSRILSVCDAVKSGRKLTTFRTNLQVTSFGILLTLLLDTDVSEPTASIVRVGLSWRWKRKVLPKRL